MAGVELAPRLGEADHGARQVLGREPRAARVGPTDEHAELGVAVVRQAAADAARRVRTRTVAHGSTLLAAHRRRPRSVPNTCTILCRDSRTPCPRLRHASRDVSVMGAGM